MAKRGSVTSSEGNLGRKTCPPGKTEEETVLLEPGVLGIRQACAVKAGAAAREKTPQAGAGAEMCVPPSSALQSLFSASHWLTREFGVGPAGSSCCAIEGKDVE